MDKVTDLKKLCKYGIIKYGKYFILKIIIDC